MGVFEYYVVFKGKVVELYDKTIGKLIGRLFKRKSSVLFLGIDNAGKTTLVNKLKYNTNHVFMPTMHPNYETIEIGNLCAHVLDVGGHKAARLSWNKYLFSVDGVVFIVDVEDSQRFEEVASAWKTVAEISKDFPVLVIMNKIDTLGESTSTMYQKPDLMQELERSVGISRSAMGKKIEVIYVSIISENTYCKDSELYKGFQWLSDRINERQNASA